MSLFKTNSAAVFGIDAHPVQVEVDLYKSGMARDFVLVGMPYTAVRESRERIKSAMMNSGFGYPNKAVTVNLAPATVRKEGAGFDLPMALGILGAMGTGLLTTAGGLLFSGDKGDNIVAFDQRDGKPLWHSRLNGVSNAPETYSLDDHQYVLVAAGDMIYAFTLY